MNTMIRFLQDYIRIDTSHPHPNYAAAIDLFIAQATKDGLEHRIIDLPSGNKVLVITYLGTDLSLPALALNHHMDVVPALPASWIKPPFAAEIHNDHIIGRGTQDAKGIGVLHYFALKALKDTGVRLQRTVHILLVPDEEKGGFKGTGELVRTNDFGQLNIGFVLDEGCASGDPRKMYIKIGERSPLQIRITAQGESGHASKLLGINAIHELVQFLHRIVGIHQENKIKHGNMPAGLLLSAHITSLHANGGTHETPLNVIPEIATATVDLRIPPTMTLHDAQAMVQKELAQFPQLCCEVLATGKNIRYPSNHVNPLYIALAQAIKKNNLIAEPLHFEAATDLRFYLELGITGIGCRPFTIKDNAHGANESVSIDELICGQHIMTDFLLNFCEVAC